MKGEEGSSQGGTPAAGLGSVCPSASWLLGATLTSPARPKNRGHRKA